MTSVLKNRFTDEQLTRIRVVAFDADDTLWDNETAFRRNEAELCQLLAPFGSKGEISARLYETEMDNMPDYGYGAVAFTMSLIEMAVKTYGETVPAKVLHQIIESGRTLVRLPATPFTGVNETLQTLRQRHSFQLVVFTKGELLTQENKLKRSGLLPYFDHTFIVTDKKEADYQQLCNNMHIRPNELLMVGNSLRSDILPALNIGALAIHIPFEVMWQHEVIDDFEHDNLLKIKQFSQLLDILKK